MKVLVKSRARPGIYVIGFCYPVVPEGQAHIRTQVCAAHKREHLNKAIRAFVQVGRELDIISQAHNRGGKPYTNILTIR